ncbi:MAG: flippase [Caldilineales bacterium]|nr:flippase [Caldilineales bacterium]
MSNTRVVARNTVFLSIAQGLRVLLGLVLVLFIANRFGVVWQGKFSILLAFLNIFQVLASFGLPRLITREVARDYGSSNNYFWNGLGAQGISTVFVMAAMVVVVAVMPYPNDTKEMLWLAVLALPIFTIYSVAAALLRAFERMEFLVIAELLSSAAQLIVAVALLSFGGTVMALAVIRIAGLGLAALVVLVAVIVLRMLGRPSFNLTGVKELLRASADFFGLAGFDALLQRMDVLILSVVVGEAATGIYDAAFQVVKVFMVLILSFTDAMYPAVSRLFVQARERFATATAKSIQYGMIVLLPLAAGLTVLAPDIISFLYRRPAYAASANVLAVLSWALLPYFVQISLTRTLLAGNRSRPAFWVTAVMVIVGAALLAAMSYLWGPTGTAWGLTLIYLGGSILAWRAANGWRITFGASCLVKPALATALMAAGLYFLPGLPVWLAGAVGMLAYGLLAFGLGVFDRDDVRILQSLVSK